MHERSRPEASTREKRGAGEQSLTLDHTAMGAPSDQAAVLKPEHALKKVAEVEPRAEQVVECRVFAGLLMAETAGALQMTLRTVERDRQKARGCINWALHN